MCGRFVLDEDGKVLLDKFKFRRLPERLRPRYNIAPTQLVLTVRDEPEQRDAAMLKWGLVPSWAKDPKIGNSMINARSETAATKPSFRAAFKSRRCIVPASGYYEWKRDGKVKVPYFIRLASGEPMGIAGLWESWRPREGGEAIETCTLLTTGPNELTAAIHDRMPVILREEDYDDWLDSGADREFLQSLMRPYAGDEMEAYAVSARVNSPRNDDEECIKAV